MPPKPKRKKIIWNNNDCKADVCLRPEGTSSWVQCDECGRWYHIPCLFLEPEDLHEDKEFYCPNCIPDKESEFVKVKDLLYEKIVELSGRQIEFGGVTIDRDMFKEKKNANPYNYSKDFPPTLRDLSSRLKNTHKTLGDLKWDYKNMCKRLTEELKDDFESRIQMVEWELDEIIEDVQRKVEHKDPEPVEVDLDSVKREKEDEDIQECGGVCEHCSSKFSSSSIYTCIREHRVCHNCRSLLPGCICPVCRSKYGDRKRLGLDHTSALLYRVANASNFDISRMGRRRRKPRNLNSPEPMIMDVWSCSQDDNFNDVEIDHVNIEGPIVKAEPDYCEDTSRVSMSTVLPENCISNQLLTLIDEKVVTTKDPEIAELYQSPQISPLSQQPTNYNDTEDTNPTPHMVVLKQEPIEQVMEEQNNSNYVSESYTSVSENHGGLNIRDVGHLVEKNIKTENKEVDASHGPNEENLCDHDSISGDPHQPMEHETETQVPVNLGETSESPWRKLSNSCNEQVPKLVSPTKLASSWAKYRARAETISKLPVSQVQKETGRKVHSLQVSSDGSMKVAPIKTVKASQGTERTHTGRVALKNLPNSVTIREVDRRDDEVEYQPSDTDRYQVDSALHFPKGLEVVHKGPSVNYQKVGENVYKKVSPSKPSAHLNKKSINQPSQPVIHTGPTSSIKSKQTLTPLVSSPQFIAPDLQDCIDSLPSKFYNANYQYNNPDEQEPYYNPSTDSIQSQLDTVNQFLHQNNLTSQYSEAQFNQCQYQNSAPNQQIFDNQDYNTSVDFDELFTQTNYDPTMFPNDNATYAQESIALPPISTVIGIARESNVLKDEDNGFIADSIADGSNVLSMAKSTPTYTIQYTKPNPFSGNVIRPSKKESYCAPPRGKSKGSRSGSGYPTAQLKVREENSLIVNPRSKIYRSEEFDNDSEYQQNATLVHPQPIPALGSTKQSKHTVNVMESSSSSTPLAVTIQYNNPGRAMEGSITPQTITRSFMVSATGSSVADQSRKGLENGGCVCVSLTPRKREHAFQGVLEFSLLGIHHGSALGWTPFLAIFAATGPEMYQFQLGRSGGAFYIRGVTELRANTSDKWSVVLNGADTSETVEIHGVFSMLGEGGAYSHVSLPSNIVQGDRRQYTIVVSQ